MEKHSENILFDNTTSRNVDLHLYQRLDGSFRNLGPLWNQDFPLSSFNELFLLAIPTSERNPTFQTFAQSITEPKKKGLSAGAIVGITLGSIFGVLLISGCAFFLIRKRGEKASNRESLIVAENYRRGDIEQDRNDQISRENDGMTINSS